MIRKELFVSEVICLLPDVEVVIITAHGSIETAVEAMKEGAFDYLTKPFSPEQVRHRLSQIERIRRLRDEVAGLRRRLRFHIYWKSSSGSYVYS